MQYKDLEILETAALKAIDKAYAPYSNFRVGAAILIDDGTVIIGANQENASYPLSLCAERVALFSAKIQHPDSEILKIFITVSPKQANQPIAPCGACRQVIYEMQTRQSSPIEIICGNKAIGYLHFPNAETLLPNPFGPSNLDTNH